MGVEKRGWEAQFKECEEKLEKDRVLKLDEQLDFLYKNLARLKQP